jgi:hypothetical protein
LLCEDAELGLDEKKFIRSLKFKLEEFIMRELLINLIRSINNSNLNLIAKAISHPSTHF